MTRDIDVIARMAELKEELDRLRPVSAEGLLNLAKWYDVKLTYASNAIEGNTLSHSETQIVVEEGITIGGKTVREHLEAIDLFEATRAVREMARGGSAVTEASVLRLHEMVLRRSEPGRAGTYADARRRVAGSDVVFPRPERVPGLMEAFGRRLERAAGWRDAIEAHFDLVTIHPFNDGNGRTARLLMNMLLMRDGYPPVLIGPVERARYVRVVGDRQRREPLGHGLVDDASREAYVGFMVERLLASLTDHLEALGVDVPGIGGRDGGATAEPPPRPVAAGDPATSEGVLRTRGEGVPARRGGGTGGKGVAD